MSYTHLTMEERNVLYKMLWLGYSKAEIARCLGRHRSSIGRECKRNAMPDGRYEPGPAQTCAHVRRRAHLSRPTTGDARLMRYVDEHLRRRWSPEQIAGRLNHHARPDLQGRPISHTTIYRWIRADPGRAQQLRPFLRIASKPRRKPYGKPSRRGRIAGKRSIDERPAEANERTRLGDWEGDTMVGKGHRGYLLTCVDRVSRYLIARKLDACAAEPVAQQLQQTIRRLPAEKRQTLTLDNGREFARPIELEKKLDLPLYFAHPYHSWERGTNENTNGLLRQYLPKGTDLTQVTDKQLRSYVRQINHRPRKCLDFQTAFEVFHAPLSESLL
jgi:IS30 family transposase